ncbi:MAG: glycosyltransferase family 2 protein [Gemmatimonadaceae bacterium]|nr:glycosyltransferase family 2 protein [Chitinophagaceae bacterium]
MVVFLEICFWLFLFIVFYTYFGYGILVYIINKVSGKGKKHAERGKVEFQPVVALVVAAYNEEDYIEDKIKNTLEIDYPAEKLKIYFVTDGSDDSTASIVARYPQITLLHQPERRGKASAMNRAMQIIQEPFVIFCDANTMLNRSCVTEMVRPYADSRVGAVAGEKKIFQVKEGKAASAGEGIYWKYESFLKKQDSILYSVVGAAGELFSVRKELYEPVEKGVIIEDFVLSLRICERGYVVKYAPEAFAVETASASVKDEQKRKVRICAGGFQAMAMLKGLFNIRKHGVLTFQYISHRVLRWSLTPVCLVLLLPVNAALVLLRAGWVYDIMMAGQLFFYVLALTGWFFANRNIKVKSLYIPYYFLFMNISVFMGFRRYLAGKQSVLWEKAARQKLV